MTYSQIRSSYAYIRPRNTRERPGSGNDLFCNIAMELILVILKMASRYPLAPFLHERCTGNRAARCSRGDVDVQMLLPFIFEQLLRLYLHIHAGTYISQCTYKNTCHFIRTRHVTLSKVWKYNGRASRDFKRSTNLKGSWCPKQLFLKKRRIQFPVAVPASKNASALNPLISRVKSGCYLSQCHGGWGTGFQLTDA